MGEEGGASDGKFPESLDDEPSLRFHPRRSRVTVDFTGPPLALPDDGGGAADELGVDADDASSLALETTSSTDALELVDRTRPSEPELDLAAEMVERFALDDFTGALRIAQLLLGRSPHHADARRIAVESEARLEQIYTSRLGGLQRVPRVVVADTDIRWLGLDNRAAFLLSRVDGTHTIDELVDVGGMPRVDALKTLVELHELGAIALR